MADASQLMREEVYWCLREDILSCTLAPGTQLHEGVLAERFAVSKSPIRDALSRLHAEKLIAVEPRKGYRVAPISLSDAADLFEFRALLEQACAQAGAAQADATALQNLDRFREFGSQGGSEAFVAYNRAFHVAVVQLSPNRRMAETARGLVEQFDRLVVMSISAIDDRNIEALVAEHNAVIDALQARDGRRAGKLLAQHVGRAEKRVLNVLANAAIVP